MDASMDPTATKDFRFCADCGQKQAIGLRFCAACGKELDRLVQQISSQPAVEESQEPSEPTLTLLQGWGCFYAGLVIMGISAWIGFRMGAIMYLAIGIFMSRFVMRRLIEWHPNYNTLYNVVSAKIWMVLLWPVRMLMLLLQLTANKVL